MRKIIMLAAGLLLIGSSVGRAESVDSEVPSMHKKDEKLLALNPSTNRVSQLERRIGSLEREFRSQNDSLRNLEREVNDLRRRR